MENEFEIWVLSRNSNLVLENTDFSTLNVAATASGDIETAFTAVGANTVSIASSEVLAALNTGVIDAAASSAPDTFVQLARADSDLHFYRFIGTETGLTERVLIDTFGSFGTDANDAFTSIQIDPAFIDEQMFGRGGDDAFLGGTGDD